MRKTIDLQIKNLTTSLPKKYSMLQLVEVLEKSGIIPIGNLSNTSKRKILIKSLNVASSKSLDRFLQLVIKDVTESKISDEVEFLTLHKEFLGTKVEKFLKNGDWDEAVRVANVRIVNRVKKLSGLNEDGVPLVQKAFSPKNPILRLSKIQDEQIGLMHFFIGSVFAFRNPPSHDDENKWLEEECISKLHIANYLMKILDKAEKVDRIDKEIPVIKRLAFPVSN